jgi:polyphosphate kinase
VLLHRPVPVVHAGHRFPAPGGARPDVVAIKLTVYRTGTDSVVMQTLIDAARSARK